MKILDLGSGKKCTVLSHVVNRVKSANLRPIVTTTTLKADDKIAEYCAYFDIECYRGSVNDKMTRWLETCNQFGIQEFVTVDCDDPLFDQNLSKRSFNLLESYDAVQPCENTYTGSVGWSLSTSLLREAVEKKTADKTEMFWNFLPENASIAKGPVWGIPGFSLEKNLRLTLDYEEDFWMIQTLIRKLGPDATRLEIVDYISMHPGLTEINAFRQEQWKANQNV